VSEQNVEIVRGGYEQFRATKTFVGDIATPDFVWDMTHFHGWPEEQVYHGIAGAESFIAEWTVAWDEWELEVEAFHHADDKVVALVLQRGRSKATGILVEMSFAQVWTLRDGKQVRMDMYSDPGEALNAVGLAP
jgi:ketosteroid isomerase-like protein